MGRLLCVLDFAAMLCRASVHVNDGGPAVRRRVDRRVRAGNAWFQEFLWLHITAVAVHVWGAS